MDLVLKLGVVAAFIATYIGYFTLSYYLQRKVARDVTADRGTVLVEQVFLLASIVGFFAFLFLLTGFLSLPLIVLFLVAAELGFVLRRVGNAVLGSNRTQSTRMTAWVAFGYGVRHPWFFSITYALAALVFVLYPIVAAYVFLLSPPDDLNLTIIRLTVAMFVVTGLLFTFQNFVGLLTSPHLDERSRATVLVSSSSGLVTTGLFLGLGYWAFSPQPARALASVPISVSIEVVVFLLGFFAISILIPYVIGVVVAKRQRADLLGRERRWLTKASHALRVLNGTSWRTELDDIAARIQQDVEDVASSDPAIHGMEQLDEGQEALALARAGYQEAQELDPRFQFRSRLQNLFATISRIVSELERRRSAAAREQLAQNWSIVLREQGEELEDEAKRVSEGVPKASLAVVGGTAVISVLLQEVTKSGWQTMVDALNR